ncbi:IQ domain-containing protein M [Ahaetulla prasina]|uniref:IQ domain-containing protein M n=1 Tax=Ahaetulla prasina TaxID=499056 RepID=UPI002649C40C|nr:IQ domain-containing protein M [Ahaetulla prasina]
MAKESEFFFIDNFDVCIPCSGHELGLFDVQKEIEIILRRKHVNIINEKVKRIGPHLDIFEAFKKLRKVPTLEKIDSAATCIQKLFKGWYERSKLKRIKLKFMKLYFKRKQYGKKWIELSSPSFSETVAGFQHKRKLILQQLYCCKILVQET